MQNARTINITMNRQFVFINVAMTADGKIDTFERKGAAISSPLDKQRVDRLRAGSDAVMVGGRTLLDEDPKLTVKSELLRAERVARGWTPNPVKVGPSARTTTLFGELPLMINPAIATSCPVPTARRVEMFAIRTCGITFTTTAS